MTDAFNSYQGPASAANEVNALRFLMRRALGKMRTVTLGKVVSVTNAGGLSPVGQVDVQLLVSQTDGSGQVVDLPVVYSLPYSRWQGGKNAIIMDPQVGDIGAVAFADRDISAVVASKDKAVPGSNRRHSLSDGLWLGCLLGDTPEQYVQFNTDGITVHSPTKVLVTSPEIDLTATTAINLTAPNIKLDGAVHVTGAQTNDSTITASGEVKSGSIGLQAHHHTAQGATAPTTPSQA